MKKETPALFSLKQSWMRLSDYMRLIIKFYHLNTRCRCSSFNLKIMLLQVHLSNYFFFQVHKEAELTVHVFPGLPPAPGQLCHGEDRFNMKLNLGH